MGGGFSADEAGARVVLDAATRAGLGVVVAELAPPRILLVNEPAERIFGQCREELLARSPLDLAAPDQRSLIEERLRRRLKGEDLGPTEITVVRPDGSTAIVDCSISTLQLDGGPGAAIFLRDVTGRRASDLATDVTYRAIVDAAPDGVAITRGPVILYMNQVALGMLGCATLDELAGRTLSDFLLPEEDAVLRDRTATMLRTGGRLPARDYHLRVGERETVVEVHALLIDFEGGPANLAFVRDVTDRRRAEAEAQRTERLAALGTLVAGVAHELNNPLSFASLSGELLEQLLAREPVDLPRARVALGRVMAGIERMAGIVRELGTFARVEGPFEPVDLVATVRSALEMTAPVLRARARLEVVMEDLPLVRGDAGRLERVIVNLLVNASQSFASADLARHRVRVTCGRQGGSASITIEDNGAGIRPEHLGRVFDPFFTTKAGAGTGLGLSICHAIVTRHGGTLDLSSVHGEGTRVVLLLPALDPSEVRPSAPRAPERARLPSTRILVVDDEPAVAHVLRDLLEGEHEVTVATRGALAEVLLLDHDPDVILCDLWMPDLSGIELYERVTARRPELAPRFVFMTGGVFPEDLAARPSVVRLQKPFRVDEILGAIARVTSGQGPSAGNRNEPPGSGTH